MQKLSLTGLLPEEISSHLPKNKEKYRGMQIFRWIHERGAESFDEMTNLPKSFREDIKDVFSIRAIEKKNVISSSDGSTDKYLWCLYDGHTVESVIIRDRDRVTACISSQAGCKMRCTFCRTGKMGFKRNISAGEIIDQLIQMGRSLHETGEDITNIVFMGMGDPLDNLDAVIKSILIINMEESMGIGQRKVTVSTCGITPAINLLAEAFKKIGLAISLNAPDDELRSSLMPINHKYPLKELLKAAGNYARITKRRVTFEYILIDGVNDSPEHARKMLAIARSVPSKINLIAFNKFEGSSFKPPSDKKIEAFQKIIFEGNITAMLRKSKGTDIYAACGQLAGGENT